MTKKKKLLCKGNETIIHNFTYWLKYEKDSFYFDPEKFQRFLSINNWCQIEQLELHNKSWKKIVQIKILILYNNTCNH